MTENLKCPSCKTKLSTSKHYDAVYEWFECPKCEGCFTYDEVLEGGGIALEEEQEEAPKIVVVKKKHVEEEPEERQVPSYYRGEVSTHEVVNIVADEIQTAYEEMGLPALDDLNAHEKALHLVRILRTKSKIRITEAEVPHVLCEAHT